MALGEDDDADVEGPAEQLLEALAVARGLLRVARVDRRSPRRHEVAVRVARDIRMWSPIHSAGAAGSQATERWKRWSVLEKRRDTVA